MDPNVFRKGNASSCLVVDKTWDDIINKPDFFDELVDRVVGMMKGAADFGGQILKTTTFREFKEAINKILLVPLQYNFHSEEKPESKKPNTVLADAFWDEIPQIEEKWAKFKDAIGRAYNMKVRIGEHAPLTAKDTLQTTKDNFNDTVVKPMLGINEDE